MNYKFNKARLKNRAKLRFGHAQGYTQSFCSRICNLQVKLKVEQISLYKTEGLHFSILRDERITQFKRQSRVNGKCKMLENHILRQHTAGKGCHLFGINLLEVDMQSASASLANWWERVKEIKQESKLGLQTLFLSSVYQVKMPLFEKTELYSCPCLHFGPSFVCLMSVAAFDWDQLAKNPTTQAER